MIFGCLEMLGGALIIAVGAILNGTGDQGTVTGLGDLLGGAAVALGIAVLVIGLVEILGGVGAWRGSEWGRVIGLIVGVLGFLFGLATAAGARNANTATTTANSFGVGLVALFIYGFIAIVLAIRWKVSAA